MGALLELQEHSGQEEPLRAIVHIHLYFHRVGRSSAKALWPTCKITSTFPVTLPDKGKKQEQPGITTHLPVGRATQAQQASAPSTISTCLAPTYFQKLPNT